MYYLVLVSKKGGYKVHSCHRSQAVAEQWAACLSHGGEDVSTAEMDKETAEDLHADFEKNK